MKTLLTIIVLILAGFTSGLRSADAKGSSHPPETQQTTSGVIRIEEASRVVMYTGGRIWLTRADGRLMVCSGTYTPEQCNEARTDRNFEYRWADVNDIRIPGYSLMGFRIDTYRGWSGDMTLLLFFKKD